MRNKMIAIIAVVVLLAMGVFVARMAAKPAPVPPRCPNIHRAVGALDAAMHDMEVAGHDFCGHKVEAMEATRRALEQLRKAEECDRCR